MADETTPAVEQGTGVPIDQIPTDFKAYDHWRRTGELPGQQAEKPAAPAAAEVSASSEAPEPPATTAPDSEPEEVQDTGTDGQPVRGGSRVRRIDRLTRENAELQQRLAALEQSHRPAATVPSSPPPAPGSSPKPDLNDFKTLEDYTEALTDWKLDQREARQKADEEKRSAEARAQAEQDHWTAKEKAAQKAHPDYQELIDATPIPQGPGVMAARQALLEDDQGAEILYWLARNPAELQRIAGLSPARAILEIGKLSAAFPSPVTPENPKPRISNAPKPPSPISHGTVKTAHNVLDDDFARRDYKAWEKERWRQLKG